MSKLKEWRKAFDDATATEGMKLVDTYIGKKFSLADAKVMAFRIDSAIRLGRGEERSRCYAATHAELMHALDIILTGKGDSE